MDARRSGLSYRLGWALLVLESFARSRCYCWVGNAQLAAALDIGESALGNLLREMEDRELIHRVTKRQGRVGRLGIVLLRRADPSLPTCGNTPEEIAAAVEEMTRIRSAGPDRAPRKVGAEPPENWEREAPRKVGAEEGRRHSLNEDELEEPEKAAAHQSSAFYGGRTDDGPSPGLGGEGQLPSDAAGVIAAAVECVEIVRENLGTTVGEVAQRHAKQLAELTGRLGGGDFGLGTDHFKGTAERVRKALEPKKVGDTWKYLIGALAQELGVETKEDIYRTTDLGRRCGRPVPWDQAIQEVKDAKQRTEATAARAAAVALGDVEARKVINSAASLGWRLVVRPDGVTIGFEAAQEQRLYCRDVEAWRPIAGRILRELRSREGRDTSAAEMGKASIEAAPAAQAQAESIRQMIRRRSSTATRPMACVMV